MRTTWLITVALLSVTAPAQAQFPRLFGGSTPAKQIIPTGENPNRVMEIQVELAWLADPQTFPHYLEAHVEGQKMVVRGCVPHASVRAHALQIARLNCTVAVVDALQENPAQRLHENSVPPAQLYTAVLAAMNEAFPQLQPYLHVDCTADGRVVVNGQAPTFEHKLAISQAVRRLNGCSAVLNRVQVGAMAASNGNLNQAQYAGGGDAAAGDPQKTRLVPNARGVMVPMHQSNAPVMPDPASSTFNQPAPPKSSRSLFSLFSGTSPAATPNTGIVPPPPTPLYAASNQNAPAQSSYPAPYQQATTGVNLPMTTTPLQQMNPRPATGVNPSMTSMPIQQMGYQTLKPSSSPALNPGTLPPNAAGDSQRGLGSLAPSGFSPSASNSSTPQNFRPASSPVPGSQSYVTQGIVYLEDPGNKSVPAAAQPVPAVSPAVLQQRVAAACGNDARACNVQILPGNKLKIEVTVANPRMVEQRDQIQGLVQRILNLPELQPYQMPEMLFQP
jgi:hypothetical protein